MARTRPFIENGFRNTVAPCLSQFTGTPLMSTTRNRPAEQNLLYRGSPGSFSQVLIDDHQTWCVTGCHRHRLFLGGGDPADLVPHIFQHLCQKHGYHRIIFDNQNAKCGHDFVATGQRIAMSFSTLVAPGAAHAAAQATSR
jgi:hypothetical protein